jgi:ABC-type antimicrobial peptide transport system permease subunit
MLTQSPYEAPMPSIFVPRGWKGVILVRINKDIPAGDALAMIESVFNKHNPEAPFEFSFVDDDYAQKFSSEVRIGKLAASFSVLAIFISLLGLFGLSSFVAEQRKREIGIRKVLGASVVNMWRMLSKDFVYLVGLSSFIAVPVSFLLMNNWLMQYEYQTELSWTIFASAISGALMVTFITVSYQAIKAALANPIKSLKSE